MSGETGQFNMQHHDDSPRYVNRDMAARAGLVCLGVIGIASLLCACASAPTPVGASQPIAAVAPSVESTYGIKVDGLRLTAAGSMLDFRYRVLDPSKAAPILDGKMKPYLLDEAHGAKLGVPDTPVLGRIRQTARNNKILTDRTYFIMFGNPGKALQSGDKVTLLLGDLKITDLTVR